MKTKLLVFSLVFGVATFFPLLIRVSAQNPTVQSQTVQVQTIVLSEKDALKNVRVEESPAAAAGILPDLTIKEMCLAVARTVPSETLRVLVANIGSRDADSFRLLLKFKQSNDDVGDWYVDTLAGLKAGEERSLEYRPMKGSGFTFGGSMVENTQEFEVIADPTYWRAYGAYDPRPYLEKSKITESNKRNNALTIRRADMRRCDSKNITRPAIPKIQTIKPVRP